MSYSGEYIYGNEYDTSAYQVGQFDASAYADPRSSSSASQRTCDKCGKKGHISRYCPDDMKSKGEGGGKISQRKSAMTREMKCSCLSFFRLSHALFLHSVDRKE